MRYALFLLAAAAFAQNASVSGRVLTSDGKAIPKVTVQVIGQAVNGTAPAYVEVTDGSGNFAVPSLPPGSYTIRTESYGFTPTADPKAGWRPVDFSLKPGEAKQGIVIRLYPLGAVSGTVLDADGNPLLDMDVRLRIKQTTYRGEEITNIGYATTDDHGQFRIAQIQAGSYYLQVYQDQSRHNQNSVLRSSRDNKIRSSAASRAYLPTYFPQATNVEAATMLEVKGAPIENVVVRMRQSGAHTVRVQVQGGVSGYSATVRLLPESEPNARTRQLDTKSWQDGLYEVSNVPPGRYRLIAMQNPPSGMWIGHAVVDVDGDTEVSIRLQAPVTVTGRVVFNGPVPPGLRILTSADDVFGVSMPQPAISADGSFRFEGVPLAKFKLLAAYTDPSAGFYMKSFRIGGRESKDHVIDLTQGNPGFWEIEMARLQEGKR